MDSRAHSILTLTQINAFENWMRSVGIIWNEDALLLDASPLYSGLALGVYSKTTIGEGEELCRIPKSACITTKTCSIADIIESEGLGGGLGLVIAVLHEASLGNDSRWGGYFAAMPHREYVPVFWNEETSLLKGTEVQGSVEEERAHMLDDFKTLVEPLIEQYKDDSRIQPEYWTLENFMNAASLVASRAFGVDEQHRDGMVPFADAFNHKVSVVDLAPEYRVHGDDQESSDDEEEWAEEGDEEEEAHCNGNIKSQKQVMRRATASDDGAFIPHSIHGITSANGLQLPLEIAIIDQEDHLQIVAASLIPAAGLEIHNTYGELGNAELVKKYGFAMRYNPFTAVKLNKERILSIFEEMYNDQSSSSQKTKRPRRSKRQANSRLQQMIEILTNETNILDEEDAEDCELLPNGHICPASYVFLRVLEAGLDSSINPQTIEDCFQCKDKGELRIERPVQIWKVTDEQGKLLDEIIQQGFNNMSADSEVPVTVPMCKVLLKAVEERLEAYPRTLQESLMQLEELNSDSRPRSSLEQGHVAQRAALLLRLSEIELLEGIKRACVVRLQNSQYNM